MTWSECYASTASAGAYVVVIRSPRFQSHLIALESMIAKQTDFSGP